MLVFPKLVQEGQAPNEDFLHLYGPTSLDVLALWYRIVGDTLESQRTFGLLQHIGIIFALYALGRAWGHVAAVGTALVASMLILTPIGLSALAWHGALAFGLWSVVFAVRATSTRFDRATCGGPVAWPGWRSDTGPTCRRARSRAGLRAVATPSGLVVSRDRRRRRAAARCGTTSIRVGPVSGDPGHGDRPDLRAASRP